MRRVRSLLLAGVMLAPHALAAQGYLLRLDLRGQSVNYRGVLLDSVPLTAIVTGPGGGPETADGFAVSCPPGASQCQFYRPGTARRGGPLVASADVTAWGFGLTGLSLHATGRLGMDLGQSDIWPGSRPALQLFEGYLEYGNDWLTARGGRQTERGRLGYTGFDGVAVGLRQSRLGLGGNLYGGLGLTRGAALPVTSPALNPLDEFQPRRRQLVAGGDLRWQTRRFEARLEYQREVDRETRNFVSERTALTATARPHPGWRIDAGGEYDIARGLFGTLDAQVRYGRTTWGVESGVRRYRPYFDLWTIWGVFSPVPYTAVDGSVWLVPRRWLDLHAAGERFWYAATDAETPLFSSEDRGWRWNGGAGATPSAGWYLTLDYRAEYGPGAASRGWDASASWSPRPELTLGAEGGHLERPLEFRFDTSRLDWFGTRADLKLGTRLRLSASATRYLEDRDRPDAAAFSWNQTRLTAGVSWLLGGGAGADQIPLPPAIRGASQR